MKNCTLTWLFNLLGLVSACGRCCWECRLTASMHFTRWVWLWLWLWLWSGVECTLVASKLSSACSWLVCVAECKLRAAKFLFSTWTWLFSVAMCKLLISTQSWPVVLSVSCSAHDHDYSVLLSVSCSAHDHDYSVLLIKCKLFSTWSWLFCVAN